MIALQAVLALRGRSTRWPAALW